MADVAPAPALPTLPHSLVHEICHYMWPADVARLANTCRSLGAREAEEDDDDDDEASGVNQILVVWIGIASHD